MIAKFPLFVRPGAQNQTLNLSKWKISYACRALHQLPISKDEFISFECKRKKEWNKQTVLKTSQNAFQKCQLWIIPLYFGNNIKRKFIACYFVCLIPLPFRIPYYMYFLIQYDPNIHTNAWNVIYKYIHT